MQEWILIVTFLFNSSIITYGQLVSPDSSLSVDERISKINSDSLVLINKDNPPVRFGQDTLALRIKEQAVRGSMKVDSIQLLIKNKMDSLSNLSQPDSALIKLIAALDSDIDSLRNKIFASTHEQYISNGMANSEATGAVDQYQKIVNEKLSVLHKKSAIGLPPSLDFSARPELQLSSGNLYDINVLKTNLPDFDLPNSAIPDLQSADVSVPIDKLPSSTMDMPDLNQTTVPFNTEGITDVTENLSTYEEQLDEVPTDKIAGLKTVSTDPNQIEERLTELDGFEDVKEQIDQADQLKRYYDPQVAKEEALIKAKQEAVNHFAGHEQELKAAMEKLSGLKSKFPDTEGALDLFAEKQKPLKGKPLVERFIPGLSLQLQKQQSFWLDVNPQVGFLISRRFTAGLGWNHRLDFDFDTRRWNKANRIYGMRTFVYFKIKENYYLQGDIECMNSPLYGISKTEIVDRGWVWSYFGGVKRDFQLSKHVKANVQLLYNLYSPDKQSPYVNRINMRLGFTFPLKQK